MGLISKSYTFVNGAVILAEEHNTNFDTLFNWANGNITNTNVHASAAIAMSKLDLTGSVTFSGDLTLSGDNTYSGESTFSGDVVLGTANQGDVYYDNGTTMTRLTPGTSGQFLQTQGAAANPQWASAVSGKPIVQVVNTLYRTVATVTEYIPYDDTIPQQSTEGSQLMAQAITPTNASNILLIDVTISFSTYTSGSDYTAFAIYQDSTENAIAVFPFEPGVQNVMKTATFSYYMVAGTTSETTFKVFGGTNSSNNLTMNGYWNGSATVQLYGGTCASSITITEITV